MTIIAEQKPLPFSLGAYSSEVIISIQCASFGDYWQAQINSGWWVGRGKTRAAAVKNVVSRFERETDWTQEK